MFRRSPATALVALAACLAPVAAPAQIPGRTESELRTLFEKVRERPIFEQAEWFFDFDAALAKARESDRVVLAYFTRSYTECPVCDAFEENVLATDAFRDLAQDVVLYVHISAGLPDEEHARLRYDLFLPRMPSIAFLDSEGRFLTEVFEDGKRTVVLREGEDPEIRGEDTRNGYPELEQLQAAYGNIRVWRTLNEQAAATDDLQAKRNAYRLGLSLRLLRAEDARRRFDDLGYSRAADPAVFQQLVDLECHEIGREIAPNLEARMAAGAKFLEMFRDDRIPQDPRNIRYWQMILLHVQVEPDLEIFQKVLDYIENEPRDLFDLKRYLPALRKELEKLRLREGEEGGESGR
jgi:hypothetical protein